MNSFPYLFFIVPIHKVSISLNNYFFFSLLVSVKSYLFIGLDKLLKVHSHKTPSVEIDIKFLSFPIIAKQCTGNL